MKIYKNIFKDIVSSENLFRAWEEFKRGKWKKSDVMKFGFNVEKNLFSLRRELTNKTYTHGAYTSFYINDPKQRHIHKATVKDRIVHHALFSVLYPIFEPTFIYDSYSCRKQKGTHKGIYRLESLLRKLSKNNQKNCFVLKCDIKKFFASVDRSILISIIGEKIKDADMMWLVREIIGSFPTGIPIGNLTSQLFANIYMNELDKFIKHDLRLPFYLRYTDDFLIIHNSLVELEIYLTRIRKFLSERLRLELHPNKVILQKHHQGVDFLGYVQFPNYRILRCKTKNRILKRVRRGISEDSMCSYLGVLSHANHFQLSKELKNLYFLNKKLKNRDKAAGDK